MSLRALSVVVLTALSACSEEASTAGIQSAAEAGIDAAEVRYDAPVDDPSSLSLTATPDEVTFATGQVAVEPGQERYVCWAATLPDDTEVIVDEISGEYGQGTHHVFFGWTLTPEPEGLTECPVLFKVTWIPVYLGGVNTSPLTMPEGAGVNLETGRQLLLQLHLQNTTQDTISNRVTMRMKRIPPGEAYTPAGIFGLDNRAISIPPYGENVWTQQMSCPATKAMNVFGVLGHMHKLGQLLEFSKNDTVVFEQPWSFDDQPITPFETTFAAGDNLQLACAHSNPSGNTVTYGESSDTEMCAIVFFYTPYDDLGGCINAMP